MSTAKWFNLEYVHHTLKDNPKMLYPTLTLIVALYMSSLYLIARAKQNNSVVDIGWGIGFIIIALISLLSNSTHEIPHLLITGLIILWGARLALHIYLRNKDKPEDKRYAAMRAAWGKWEPLYSFFQIFMLQGFLMLLVAYPIVLINTSSNLLITPLFIIGLLMWSIGFFFEAVGDYQLTQFLKNATNKGHVMRYGLWQYTRHPNYFGELMMWWGIFLMAVTLPGGFIAIISPLIMTILLLFISGIPLLEKPFNDNPEFQDYKRKTSALIPWFPKKEDAL
jgi:steroid 5-alpha reductase family enzyme